MSQTALPTWPSALEFIRFSLWYCCRLPAWPGLAWTANKQACSESSEGTAAEETVLLSLFHCPRPSLQETKPCVHKRQFNLALLRRYPRHRESKIHKFQKGDLISIFPDQTQNAKLHSETRISLQLKFFLNSLQQKDPTQKKKKRKSFTYSPLRHSSTFQCDH